MDSFFSAFQTTCEAVPFQAAPIFELLQNYNQKSKDLHSEAHVPLEFGGLLIRVLSEFSLTNHCSRVICTLLLNHGACIRQKSASGFTALHYAVFNKNELLVQDILKHHPELYEHQNPDSPLSVAAKDYLTNPFSSERLENIMISILQADTPHSDPDLLAHYSSLFLRLIPKMTPELLMEFRAVGVNIHSKDHKLNNALHLAARYGNKKIFSHLLNLEISASDLNADGHSAKDLSKYHQPSFYAELTHYQQAMDEKKILMAQIEPVGTSPNSSRSGSKRL